MGHINVEFKARCSNPEGIRHILSRMNADYKGMDHQIDFYFDAPKGRLKLRRGNIENTLIYYEREDKLGPKKAKVNLFEVQRDRSEDLEHLLRNSLGIKVIVDKDRHIYFIDNVKFHVDLVKDLGSFLEVEAIDKEGNIGLDRLKRQSEEYLIILGVEPEDLVSKSYSDLLLERYDKK
jgi:predicted adenylyl cyclase CyaB